jgi:hypothetical protein
MSLQSWIFKEDNRRRDQIRDGYRTGYGRVLVCIDCGERYYDRKTMRKLKM